MSSLDWARLWVSIIWTRTPLKRFGDRCFTETTRVLNVATDMGMGVRKLVCHIDSYVGLSIIAPLR